MIFRISAVLVSWVLLNAVVPLEAQWARFRGPNGSGVDTSTGYPTEFSPTKNVAWRVAVAYGQSSPVIVGARLYLTASDGDRLITMCLDTRSGKELSLASTSPVPSFASALAQYDKDKDGRLAHAEFKDDKEMGEHFGYIDANNDGFVVPAG